MQLSKFCKVASAINLLLFSSQIFSQTPNESSKPDSNESQPITISNIDKLKREDLERLKRELKTELKSFEVRGFKLGSDHLIELIESGKLPKSGIGIIQDEYPFLQKERAPDGSQLIFFNNVLFSLKYTDIHDPIEVRAVINRLEEKFGAKFSKPRVTRSKSKFKDSTNQIYTLQIGNFGAAQVTTKSEQIVDFPKCVQTVEADEFAKIPADMKSNFITLDRFQRECTLRLSVCPFSQSQVAAILSSQLSYSRDRQARVKSECQSAADSAEVSFSHKLIEAIVNRSISDYLKKNIKEEPLGQSNQSVNPMNGETLKIKMAIEKAKAF